MDNRNLKNILIIGDSCVDIFVYGDVNRICPEAPVPILNLPDTHRKVLVTDGMSRNVKANIKALNPNFEVNIYTHFRAISKKRYVDSKSGNIVLRVDEESPIKDKFDWEVFYNMLKNIDCVVVSDYNKGFLDFDDIAEIGRACKNNDIISFLDTKKDFVLEDIVDYNFVKINKDEFDSLSEQLKHEIKTWKSCFIVTEGGDGCSLYINGHHVKFASKKVDVNQVSGAGDSFLAGLVTYYCEGNSIEDSIGFANRVAGIAVSKTGVATVHREELKEF